MTKLQLYISISRRGFKSVQNINPAEAIQRYIRDQRTAIESIDYDISEKYLFFLLSYIPEGSFLTILRTIPGEQTGDHLAATIFVPNGMEIKPEELGAVVNHTTRIVSNANVTPEDVAELHEIFGHEYVIDADAAASVASEGREYAVCYYGGETGRKLTDFFGDKIYQPEFLDYAGVLLIDEDLGVAAHDCIDVSAEELATIVTMLPPEPSDEGFTPHIYHHPFDRPYKVPLGSDVTIAWKRGGFEDIQQVITVETDGMQPESISAGESRKTISPASFYITSQASKSQIPDPVITVNGVEIREAHSFTQSELRNADVSIRAAGYFPFRSRLDLAATTQALIQLQEQVKIYRFELPKKTSELGAPIRFEIHTKREITDSPIDGYALLDDIREGSTRVNHLEYTGGSTATARRNMIIAACGALVLGFLLGWLIMGGRGSKTEETADTLSVTTTETVTEAPAATPVASAAKPAEAAKPAAAQSATPTEGAVPAEAIKYLDDESKWTRDGLAKYPQLAGLFDDLNNYRLERVTTYWAPRLKNSSRFTKLATFAEQSQKKKIFQPKQGETYCTDNIIAFPSYFYKIDPAKK